MCICIYTYTYIHRCTCTYMSCIHIRHTYIHTYIHTCIHAYVPTYLRTYVPTYLRTYVPTCMHTYIQTDRHIDIQIVLPQKLSVPYMLKATTYAPASSHASCLPQTPVDHWLGSTSRRIVISPFESCPYCLFQSCCESPQDPLELFSPTKDRSGDDSWQSPRPSQFGERAPFMRS